MGAAKENRDRKHMREVFDRETAQRQRESDLTHWLNRLTDERDAARVLADTQATELAALRAKVAELEAQNATLTEERDEAIARDVVAEYRENAFDNLADAAERTRLIAHRHARAAEATAKAAAAVASAAEQAAADALERAGGEEAIIDTPVAEAERAETEATTKLGAAKEARRRRLALLLGRRFLRGGCVAGVGPRGLGCFRRHGG